MKTELFVGLLLTCLQLAYQSLTPFNIEPTHKVTFYLHFRHEGDASCIRLEGLWLADLSVTQIIQEKVEEEHRGGFNGVQSSMNMVMDLIKYALVTIFPGSQTFGYLVIASFLFICLG